VDAERVDVEVADDDVVEVNDVVTVTEVSLVPLVCSSTDRDEEATELAWLAQ